MIVNGWFDWADRIAGPEDKLWEDHPLEGVTFHSAVGTLQSTIDVVLGPRSNERSVTAVIGYDGRLVQFYALHRSPWANGQKAANLRYKGFEFEGGGYWPNGSPNFSEPLTPEQVSAGVHVLKDLGEYSVHMQKLERHRNLREHNEFKATACPSGRIPWNILIALATKRNFIAGDENGGIEKRGNQLFIWNNGLDGNAIGDYAGQLRGAIYHLRGDIWEEVTNEDPNV